MQGKCLICGRDAGVSSSQNFDGTLITCNRCGKIILEDSALCYLDGKEGGKFQSCLYHYFTHYKRNNGRVYLIIDSDNTNEDYNTVSVKQIMNLYPKNISDRIDKILLNWETLMENIGHTIDLIDLCSYYYQAFFIDYEIENGILKNNQNIEEQIQSIVDILLGQGFIRRLEPGLIEYLLDYNGWLRIDELQKQLKTRQQGFVAMWFPEDHSMDECRKAIGEVFEETGYRISIIDEKQHNNQIVPEILYEMQMSDFVIADLTGNRNGVYYEAGYALGLGKPVILITDKRKIDEDYDNAPHFDVAQINQIRYEDYDDLKIQLFNRITATVGNLKNPSAELKKRKTN